MSVAAVALRLCGDAPDERIHAWVRALGRVDAPLRSLQLPDVADAPDDLDRWLDETGVQRVAADARTDAVDVLVLADATALPTPSCLRLLVADAAGGAALVGTRVLPHGAAVLERDGATVPAPHACVAVPMTAGPEHLRACTAAEAAASSLAHGTDVRRLEAAAVLVDQAPAHPAPPGDVPPYGHPAALPSSTLHRVLLDAGLTPPRLPTGREQRPFLTVITRTQGTRLQCLEEVLTCLSGQSSRDFEVVLACHRVADDAVDAVRHVVETMPAWLAARTRLIEVERPGRSSPLNDALDVAQGRYAVVLDDDDAVAPDWVAAFAALEAEHPGVVLRSVALAQEVRPVLVDDDGPRGPVPVETGPAHRIWPDAFSMVDHLWDNASPPMTFAVPRGVFGDLGHRFDESLDTTEDWDFLMRAAVVTGVASTPAVTATYRVWNDGEGSRHLHDEQVWASGREAVLATLDGLAILLQPGAAREVRDLHRALAEETAEKFRFARLNEQAAQDLGAVNEAVAALREQVAELRERNARLRRRLT
ncbi:Glycosyltransferase like family 2 [Nocardioides alpinus]|uniref:Glycosyltransferase like family 2 n=1 Tax=Nocardioides alpinus TaxID=748909 RepID=A0A1I0WGQ3_9ACTN|nr:glycosyltransferase family 2 protein [Nocardioides alpinus]PKH37924.1 hypothetical protein CXG46_21315 [Nocardioides alpinus]SFA87949.1 Glycosyltransferase like family 2 [Nocardioides alpinus]